jgi:AmmeMemoRadiSam system protein A
MALSAFTEITTARQTELLRIARDAIEFGLRSGEPMPADALPTSGPLGEERAVFVTLTLEKNLRGCIGTLEASDILARSVASSAYSAAFQDPRFPPMTPRELPDTVIEISVLSELEPVHAASREDLLAQLRPGVDGLLLQDGHRRSTFLPKVWEQLPDPAHFIANLLTKAGLPEHHWSPAMRVKRYTTLSFNERTPRRDE